MTPEEIRMAVLDTISQVAPDADLASLAEDDDLQRELDLDSLDFFNVIVALSETLGVDIPERDYPSLTTLQGWFSYLSGRLATHG